MILIRANTERQIPVIRATLALASASKYVYDLGRAPTVPELQRMTLRA